MWPTQERDPVLDVGIDAAIKHDRTVLVAVSKTKGGIQLERVMIWTPSPEQPLHLESTIEHALHELRRQGFAIGAVLCDPWQLQRSIHTLSRAGFNIVE